MDSDIRIGMSVRFNQEARKFIIRHYWDDADRPAPSDEVLRRLANGVYIVERHHPFEHRCVVLSISNCPIHNSFRDVWLEPASPLEALAGAVNGD